MKKKNASPTPLISSDNRNIIVLCVGVFAVLFAIWTFTGKWPWVAQPYNSYILQAQAWLNGRLDLGQNYSHLEIAIYNGKYFISFPPFPSYIMLPFVMFGFDKCDGFIALVSALTAAVYAYKILTHFNIKGERAVLFSLLLTVGSNWLFTSQIAWVWFIAQNMAFTLSLMAIYYALKNKAGLSLTVWACAVGCRPFQAVYLPILLYLIFRAEKSRDEKVTVLDIIKARWKCIIPMAVIALSYMVLNFARFGNPIEFGHNYLPEHTDGQYGQFHPIYMKENILSLFRLPEISFKDKWEYQAFNGTNMFMISPIFISWLAYMIYALKKNTADRRMLVLATVCIAVQLLAITAHATMGGSQFGNRYTNDVLPMVFLCLAASLPQDSKYDKLNVILLLFGFTVNVVGSVLYYA